MDFKEYLNKHRMATLEDVAKEMSDKDFSLYYSPKTDEELKQLAQDIYDGKVFTTSHITSVVKAQCEPEQWQISFNSLALNIFLPLAFAKKEDIQKMVDNNAGFTYEYMSKAVAGVMDSYGVIKQVFPAFTTCTYVTKEEAKKVQEYYSELDPISKFKHIPSANSFVN